MKRSVAISLALIGSGIALSGCEQKSVDAAAYSSPDQCIAAGKFSREDCLSDYQTAVADHQKTAPAFSSKRDCEDEFGDGKCQQAAASHPAGHNSFTPFMMGYLMGNRSPASQVAVAPQALYNPKNSPNFVNGRGVPVTKSLGSFTLKSRSSTFSAPSPTSKTISRGGFGGRSSFGGSFGG
jgi:Predicted integral membrane protein